MWYCSRHFSPFQALYTNLRPRTVNRHTWLMSKSKDATKNHKIPLLLQPAFLDPCVVPGLSYESSISQKRTKDALLLSRVPSRALFHRTLSSRSLKRSKSALLKCRVEGSLSTHLTVLRPQNSSISWSLQPRLPT